MKRISALGTALFFAFATAACGGEQAGEMGGQGQGAQASAQAQTGGQQEAGGGSSAVTMPDWFQYDEANNAVTLELTAGSTTANNSWNYNGYFGGEGEIFVPQGATVTIDFVNEDPNMAHSVGVDNRRSNFPANFSNPEPVFEGAITSNPTSMTDGTMPGESETITFTASEPGEYSLICYVPGHAAVGMYIHFTVTTDGQVGFRE